MSGGGGEDHSTDRLLGFVLGAVWLVIVSVWAGAIVATHVFGETVPISLAATVSAFIRQPTNIYAGWRAPIRDALPSAFLYWLCTGVCFVFAFLIIWLLWRLVRRPAAGTMKRKRAGVDQDARMATGSDIAPMVVGAPETGRLLLGRVGKKLLATEHRELSGRGRGLRRIKADQRGDLFPVLAIAGTRGGKTTMLISGVKGWGECPAVVFSPKWDLLANTINDRRGVGQVLHFDPSGEGPTARWKNELILDPSEIAGWSPLRACRSWESALQAAKRLGQSGGLPSSDAKFWESNSVTLLSPMMFAAAHRNLTMSTVAEWVLTRTRTMKADQPCVIEQILLNVAAEDPVHGEEARWALKTLRKSWAEDPRLLSNIFATTTTVLEPWQSLKVGAATQRCTVDLNWLMDNSVDERSGKPRANTMYVTCPMEHQERLATVIGGCLVDLVDQAYAHSRLERGGGALERRVLFVIDEAGAFRLDWLDAVVATCAGHGIQLACAIQSSAQWRDQFGVEKTDGMLSNFDLFIGAGLSDEADAKLIDSLIGDEQVMTTSFSSDVDATRGTLQQNTQHRKLLAQHTMRQMAYFSGLLIHGRVPPVHIKLIKWWEDPLFKKVTERPIPLCAPTGNNQVTGPTFTAVEFAAEPAPRTPLLTKPSTPTTSSFTENNTRVIDEVSTNEVDSTREQPKKTNRSRMAEQSRAGINR
jgi:type IV secretion system protein VirD4